jgi:hypothetical protein
VSVNFALMDFLTFDRVLAVLGFAIAFWQIEKTRSAAEAAREAAARAVVAIRRLEAATKMHDISSRSRELLRLLRSTSMGPAASAAFELRDTVARYRHDPEAKRLVDEDVWEGAVLDVRSVHERLESLAMTKSSSKDREALLHEVGRLHTLFTEIAAQAGAQGTSDVHSS